MTFREGGRIRRPYTRSLARIFQVLRKCSRAHLTIVTMTRKFPVSPASASIMYMVPTR